jgi:4-hydroxy-3-polyprenylbenzoate decarboxylase
MNHRIPNPAVAVAMTGASGAQYGLRLIECLVKADYQVLVMFTRAAQIVVGSETDCKLPGRTAEQTRHLASLYGARDGQLRVYGDEEWTSPVASGSGAPRSMVVCPASMATVSAVPAVPARICSNALPTSSSGARQPRDRAAGDAVFGHSSRNMLKLSRLSVTILPAIRASTSGPAVVPSWFHRCAGADQLYPERPDGALGSGAAVGDACRLPERHTMALRKSLFPLGTVLFPGGPLPLRIFETRYIDLVRRCMRDGMGFGVVLIREGVEAGGAATTFDVGTYARIVDFSQQPDGLLGISCLGEGASAYCRGDASPMG